MVGHFGLSFPEIMVGLILAIEVLLNTSYRSHHLSQWVNSTENQSDCIGASVH
jgi:hypothetical protein